MWTRAPLAGTVFPSQVAGSDQVPLAAERITAGKALSLEGFCSPAVAAGAKAQTTSRNTVRNISDPPKAGMARDTVVDCMYRSGWSERHRQRRRLRLSRSTWLSNPGNLLKMIRH